MPAEHHPLLGMLRFGVAYLLSLALIALAVQAVGALFLANGSPALILLCVAAAVVSAALLLSPLSDWACWLLVQILGILASARMAVSGAALASALSPLPDGVLSLALPDWAPAQRLTIAVGPEHAAHLLLLLLGMLTWELTWGVLWLILRAGYAWAAVIMAGANVLLAADVSEAASARFLPFLSIALALILWHTWSWRVLQAQGQVAGLRPGPLVAASLAGGLAALGLVVSLAWTIAPTPGTAMSQWAVRAWSRLWPDVRDPLQLLHPPGSPALPPSGFGATLSVTGPFLPYQGVVMRVTGVPAGMRPYWRGRIYDAYDLGGWHTSAGVLATIPAWGPIPADVPRHPSRRITVQIASAYQADGLLFAPGRPLLASLPSQVLVPPAGSGGDPSTVYAAGPLPASGSYTVVAEVPFSVPRPDAAGPLPDAWYTSLPTGLDPALADLAWRLTAGRSTALEKALAIQAYLLSGAYTYDTGVGPPPAGRDPLAYFLFKSHRGYCVHFASAMALLARLAGLPARVVGGYASGHQEGDAWVVDGSDAHTWPEIFFSGTGWVPFEPTPGFTAPAARATQPAPAPSPAVRVPTAAPRPAPRSHPPAAPAAPVALQRPAPGDAARQIAALAGILGLIAASAALLRARLELQTIRGIYRRLCALSRRLAVRPHPWQTPSEFARSFAGGTAERADVRLITDLYVRACYGGETPDAHALHESRLALR